MKFGARNQLKGKVTDIKRGGVMCQVKLEIEPGTMNSVMTIESAEDLGIGVGDQVNILVKAINVLVAKD